MQPVGNWPAKRASKASEANGEEDEEEDEGNALTEATVHWRVEE